MTDWLLPALAGFGTGILSAWGVGGGTLLLLLMTLFLGVDQTQAQGINLLYFLPTAGPRSARPSRRSAAIPSSSSTCCALRASRPSAPSSVR